MDEFSERVAELRARWVELRQAERDERGIPAHTPAGIKGAHQLHAYWTKGEGLAKWAGSPHPWTALRNHLLKYLPPGEANRTASQWFHDVFGIWPGERKGKNPAGPG